MDTALPIPTAPAVRCFLHYLGALRAADVAVPVAAGEEDAVHVLTLHQSKGLEFPVVYLPGLVQGEFPAGATIREEVCPPGFRESDAPGEQEAEERCLFYVGVTRARDVVALTRAASYGKAAGGTLKKAQRSPLLALVDGATSLSGAAPLLPDEEMDRLVAESAALQQGGDEEDDDEAAETPARAGRMLDGAVADKPVVRLHDLEQYLTCPQQYKYARVYGLLDPAEDAVYRFHRYIRRGAQALREVQASDPAAAWPEAETQLQALWETDGPAGHAYDAFYWQAAVAILRAEWQTLTSPDGAETAGRVLLAQALRAELTRCIVEVTADRVITNIALPGAAGNVSGPPLTVLVRLHTGRPREEDKDDLALPLYYLAHRQQHPDVPVRIVLAYAGGALTHGAAWASEPWPGDLVDVTDSARQAAEKYLKPDRRQRSKLDKLDEAADGIAAGRFAPRPQEQQCAVCAFCYVCPADPDDAAPLVPLLLPSAAQEAPLSLS